MEMRRYIERQLLTEKGTWVIWWSWRARVGIGKLNSSDHFFAFLRLCVFCVGSWGLGSYPPSMGLRSPQSVVSHLPVLVELELRVLPALVDEPEDLTTKFSASGKLASPSPWYPSAGQLEYHFQDVAVRLL
jgi:hypothetical protein